MKIKVEHGVLIGYFTSTTHFGILPLNFDLASAPIPSTTEVARSMPTSAVTSAEKITGCVRSILPSPTFTVCFPGVSFWVALTNHPSKPSL
jgi:hypothetical protein